MERYLVKKINSPKLKNPILIEGLPGVGNVGKIAVDFLIDKFEATKFDSLITLQQQEYPPWWMFRLENNQLLTAFEYHENINVFNMERQEFPCTYKPNGSVYVTWSNLLRKNHQLVNPDSCGYLVVEDNYQVNIDTDVDFMVAQAIVQKKDKK